MKTIKSRIEEIRIRAKQIEAVETVVAEIKHNMSDWMVEAMQEDPKSKFGCMVHFNKEQYDALMSILNQI